jgi:O-antigen/teichoic acid export membrane protein
MTLRTKVLKATFWLSAGSTLSQVISYGSTFLLAGFLSPDEMGKAAIGSLIVASAGLLREMGIGYALIYIKDRVEDAADTGFILISLASIALYALVFALSDLASTFFRDPVIAPLVRVMALTLIANSLTEVPSCLFEKRLAFDRQTTVEITNLTSYSVLVVVLAYAGLSFWSIAYAGLASAVLSMAVAWWLSPWRPKLNYNSRLAKEIFRYGRRVVETNIINFGIRNLDNAIVGRMLDPATLGAYDLAYRVANIPATTVTPVISRVMFPVYTQLSDHTYDLRNAFLKAIKFTSVLIIPVSAEILLLAPGAISYFYNHTWDSAIRPIQILTFYGLVRSFSSGPRGIFLVLNRVRTMTKILTGQLVILLALLYPAARLYGLEGICWVSVGAMACSTLTQYITMCPLIELRYTQILQRLWSSLTATTLAAGLAYTLCLQITNLETLTFLILQPCITTIFYLSLITALDHEVRELLSDLIRHLRQLYTG